MLWISPPMRRDLDRVGADHDLEVELVGRELLEAPVTARQRQVEDRKVREHRLLSRKRHQHDDQVMNAVTSSPWARGAATHAHAVLLLRVDGPRD